MKYKPYIALGSLWLVWLLTWLTPTPAQCTLVYQQFINPNPRSGVPWDDSGVWVGSAPLGPGVPLNIDMDLNGIPDFQISTDGRAISIFAVGNGEVISLRNPPPDLSSHAARLSAGQQINSSAPVPYEWTETFYASQLPVGSGLLYSDTAGTLGFWGGQFGYLGVRIWKSNAWHYGWIRGGVPLSIVPEGVFYEAALNLTPSAGILAGAKPVVALQALPEIARPGFLRLRWLTEIGKAYQVQGRENLSALLWTNLDFVIVATATNAVADIPITGAKRFYRVVEAD